MNPISKIEFSSCRTIVCCQSEPIPIQRTRPWS